MLCGMAHPLVKEVDMDTNHGIPPRDSFLTTLADRWEADPVVRGRLSALLALFTLVGMVFCFALALLVVRRFITPQAANFSQAYIAPDIANGHPLFPIATPQAGAPQDVSTPLVVPTTTLPVPTPTLASQPTVTATAITGTPPGAAGTPTNGVATCPPVVPPSNLTGTRILDGAGPTPLIAGCPGAIYINAPNDPDAPITINLSFSLNNPGACTLNIANVWTDARGQATVTFTVPGTYCVRGTVMTTGTITIGSDTSANANFMANG